MNTTREMLEAVKRHARAVSGEKDPEFQIQIIIREGVSITADFNNVSLQDGFLQAIDNNANITVVRYEHIAAIRTA